MHNILRYLVICLFLVITVNCSVQESNETKNVPTGQVGEVEVGQVRLIPTNKANRVFLPVVNNSWHDVALKEAWIDEDDSHVSILNKQNINISNCDSIKAGATCMLEIEVHNNSKNYLVTLSFADLAGTNSYYTRQIISFTGQLPRINNLIYDPSLIYDPKKIGGRANVVLPVVLAKSIKSFKVISSDDTIHPYYKCTNGLNKDSMCSVIMSIANFNAKEVRADITILADNITHKVPLLLTTQNIPNVITTGYNVAINPANGTTQASVTLLKCQLRAKFSD